MKKNYFEPMLEVVEFSAEDVILASYNFDNFETNDFINIGPELQP